MPKKVKEGRYLICIVRKNGDFYRYDMTDNLQEATEIHFQYLGDNTPSKISKIAFKNRLKSCGVFNHNTTKVYTIDTEFDINSKDLDEKFIKKFKKIKRLYGIKEMGI